MDGKRKGETGPVPFRTGRFVVVDSAWYFLTREGIEHGPFPTRNRAERECLTFIKVCFQVEERLGSYGKSAPPPKTNAF